jgi:hypothetical protein
MSSLAAVGKTCCVGKKTFHTPLTAGCEVFLLKSCNQVSFLDAQRRGAASLPRRVHLPSGRRHQQASTRYDRRCNCKADWAISCSSARTRRRRPFGLGTAMEQWLRLVSARGTS